MGWREGKGREGWEEAQKTVRNCLEWKNFCCCGCIKSMLWVGVVRGGSRGGLWGLETPLQKYIREAKRMMYWYRNTLKCIIS